jgi:hypothetical protein
LQQLRQRIDVLPGAGTGLEMIAALSKNWFREGGLFAKYVMSLVGLVVFVLAVNGAIETWFIYRETQSTLSAAMA